MAILAWPSYPLPLPRRRRRGGGGGGGKVVPDLARAMRTVYAKKTVLSCRPTFERHSSSSSGVCVPVCECVCVCVRARARVLKPHGLSLDQKFGSETILIAVKSSDQDLNSHATSPSSVFSSCTFLTLYAAWRPGRTIALLACGASC